MLGIGNCSVAMSVTKTCCCLCCRCCCMWCGSGVFLTILFNAYLFIYLSIFSHCSILLYLMMFVFLSSSSSFFFSIIVVFVPKIKINLQLHVYVQIPRHSNNKGRWLENRGSAVCFPASVVVENRLHASGDSGLA